MAESVVTVAELENRFKLPQGSLDEECTDEHIKEIALLLDSWELLASHLGLNTQQIDAIKEENRSQEVKRKNALTKWKETFDYIATYRKLVEKLVKINRADLAGKVCKLLAPEQGLQQSISAEKKPPTKHLPSGHRAPPHPVPLSVSPHQDTIGTHLPPTQSLEPSDEKVVANFTTIVEIEDAFRDLVVDVEEYFEGNVPLVKLQRYSCHLPVSLKGQFGQLFEGKTSRIWNVKTVGELFTILSYFWDYLHPDLLHYLVKQFGTKETVDLVSGYLKELSKFRKKVKIPDYIGERRINLVDDDYTPIIAILGDEWCEKTLADLEEVRCNFSKKFSFLRLLPKMNGLKYNSIALIFSVPKSVQFDNDELCEFFRSYNVLKLTVGEECIYDDGDQQISGTEDQAFVRRPPENVQRFVVAEPLPKKQKIGYRCEFVEQPQKALQTECPICLCILRDPYQAYCCGKCFCSACYKHLKSAKSTNKACPTCNNLDFPAFEDKSKKQALSQFKVYCTHHNSSCQWTGELGDLDRHLNEDPKLGAEKEGCGFTKVGCLHCQQKFERQSLHTHPFGQCPRRRVHCKNKGNGCKWIGELREREIHLNTTCMIACPNKCGENIRFVDVDNHIEQRCEMTELMKTRSLEAENTAKTEKVNVSKTTSATQVDEIEQLKANLRGVQQEKASTTKVHQVLQASTGRVQQQMKSKVSWKWLIFATSVAFLILAFLIQYTLIHNSAKIRTASSTVEKKYDTQDYIQQGFSVHDFTLTEFKKCQARGGVGDWYSEPFYFHPGGYMFQLNVETNGWGGDHGVYMGVSFRLLPGDHDGLLHWPVSITAHVRLLNQLGDHTHHEKTSTGSWRTRNWFSAHITQFFKLSEFGLHVEKNIQYLKNDCLKFQVYFKVDEINTTS